MRGAAALLHDARFDPHERLRPARARARERALHGADRVPRDRQARAEPRPVAVAARPASPPARRSTPRSCARWREATGPVDPRRLRADRDRRRLTGAAAGARPRGRARWAAPLPGVRLWIDDGELCLDPAHRSRRSSSATSARACGTSAARAGRRPPRRRHVAHGRPGQQDEDGYLYFEGRADDVIIIAGLPDRPVRGRVRARLPPRGRRGRGGRGARRRARLGRARGRRAARRPRARRRRSPRELQDHVKRADRAVQVPADRRVRRRRCRRPRAARCAARCCETGHDASARSLRDAGRPEVATFVPGTRDGRPLADRLAAAPGARGSRTSPRS